MSKAMERALFISNSNQLRQLPKSSKKTNSKRLNSLKSFQRIYFGQEFCETLLPNKTELLAVKDFCKKQGLKLSFVTPYLTDSGLKRALALTRLLSKEDELVVNDYGLLHAVQGSKPILTGGRLLNRQFRDPRIALFKDTVPRDFFLHLQQSHASSPKFLRFLQGHGIKRVELDNLLQGIGTDLSKSPLRASLYYPFAFISTTRLCLTANCGKISSHNKIGIFPCARDCRLYQFRLTSSLFPVELFVFGNTVFSKNSKLPKESELQARGIDRLVTNTPIQLSE